MTDRAGRQGPEQERMVEERRTEWGDWKPTGHVRGGLRQWLDTGSAMAT